MKGKYDSKQDTQQHITTVSNSICKVIMALNVRAIAHDKSKTEQPEKAVFDEVTPQLKGSTYGSEEYLQFLRDMKPALDHHYAANRHHPEHFENGIRGMTLVDLIEMFCDWYAATQRHADGDIKKSIVINQKRFGYGDDLADMFRNTIALLEEQPGNDEGEK